MRSAVTEGRLETSNATAADYEIQTDLAAVPTQSTTVCSLRSVLPSCCAVASARSDDAAPATFSSSGMTLAGEKKCMPITSADREVAEAIWSMSRVEVFVARMAPGLHTCRGSQRSAVSTRSSSFAWPPAVCPAS